jgi:PAS domain S-box-containing protein
MHEEVILIDSKTRVVYANESYFQILGLKDKDVIGQELLVVQPDTNIIKVVESGKPLINVEFTFSPTNVRIVANILPIFNNNGSLFGAISVFRDVTEVKELIQQIEHLKGCTEYLQERLEGNKELLIKNLVGDHPAMQQIVEKIKKVAKPDSTVLITGESVTGKEVVASTIHQISNRQNKQFNLKKVEFLYAKEPTF